MKITKLQAKALTAFMSPFTWRGEGEDVMTEMMTEPGTHYSLFVSEKDAKRYAAALTRLLAKASEFGDAA